MQRYRTPSRSRSRSRTPVHWRQEERRIIKYSEYEVRIMISIFLCQFHSIIFINVWNVFQRREVERLEREAEIKRREEARKIRHEERDRQTELERQERLARREAQQKK